jgi:hypothetical protein
MRKHLLIVGFAPVSLRALGFALHGDQMLGYLQLACPIVSADQDNEASAMDRKVLIVIRTPP